MFFYVGLFCYCCWWSRYLPWYRVSICIKIHSITSVCASNIHLLQRLYVRNKTQHWADVLLTLVYIWGSLEHRYITEDTDPMAKPMISLVVKDVSWKDTEGKAVLEHTVQTCITSDIITLQLFSDFPSCHFTLVKTKTNIWSLMSSQVQWYSFTSLESPTK